MPQESSSSGATRALILTAVLLAFGFFTFVISMKHSTPETPATATPATER